MNAWLREFVKENPDLRRCYYQACDGVMDYVDDDGGARFRMQCPKCGQRITRRFNAKPPPTVYMAVPAEAR